MANKKKGFEEEFDSKDSPLAERIKLKEKAASILRQQLDNSLNAGKSMHEELKSQLEQKERDLESLKELLVKKNLEVDSLSKNILAKNDTDAYYVGRLKEALLKKDAANQQVFSSLKQQLDVKDEELKKYQVSYAESSKANDRLIRQLNEQLSQAYEQIDQMKTFVANETSRSENLSNVFEKELADKEATIAELQRTKLNSLGIFDLPQKMEQLESKLKEKDALCRNLQIELAKARARHDSVAKQLNEKDFPDYSAYERQIGVLKLAIAEKDSEIKRLESDAFGSGKASEQVIRQLNLQLKEAYSEIDQLKDFVASESLKSSRLEEEFDKQISEKDIRLAELERSLKDNSKPRQGNELSELRQMLNIKEQGYELLQADLLKLKAQNISLTKKLETSRKILAEGEENFTKLADESNSQHQQRLKDLINKQAASEAALRSEIEQLKSEIKKKDKLIEAETLKVDDALSQFSNKYQQLLKLRNFEGTASHLEELEKARTERENMSSLLKDAEAKLQRAIEREAAVDRREQMLMREQDAINKQLELLKAAGFEIGRTKEFLKKKLSEVEIPAPESMASVMEEVPSPARLPREIPEIKMKIPEPEEIYNMESPKQAAPEMPKLFKPKKEEFYNANTYSELDEIKSIIEIATQQGDSTEQITHSLLDSGYSKDAVEKALSSMQTIKR
jgi:hypothetical protein